MKAKKKKRNQKKEVKQRYDVTLTPSRVVDSKKRHNTENLSKLVDDLLLITLYDYTDS